MEVAIIDKAIAKITDEMMAIQSKEPMAVPIEEHLSSICTNDIIAGRLLRSLSEGKTLKGCISSLWSEARKRKIGSVAVMSDTEAFELVDKYFDIEPQEQKNIKAAAQTIDIMDFL